MTDTIRIFDTEAILSITTGVLMRDMDDIYEILNYMTNDDLMTHQLPRAADQCKQPLEEQFPWAKGLEDRIKRDGYAKVLAEVKNLYGVSHSVIPLHAEDQTHHEPITELLQMLDGRDDIQIITLDDLGFDDAE